MKIIGIFLKLIGGITKIVIVLAISSSILFVAYKGNQPMQVPQSPKGMTYFEFITDRIDAAKTVEPSRCGWGMMLSLAVLGPIYCLFIPKLGFTRMVFLPEELPQIQIFLRMWPVRNGLKCREFGGILLSGCPGRCWENRQHMDVNLGQSFNNHLTNITFLL